MSNDNFYEKTLAAICEDEEGINFSIPFLQRAYKWKELQITQLLEDLQEFIKSKNEKYIMQPLVLVKEDNNTYEVLDGQQRLTSFLILYKALYSDDLPYTLKYEKEVNQFKYIKNLKYKNDSTNYNTISEYYIQQAFNTICEYFQKHEMEKEGFKKLFKNNTDKNIVFLWYITTNEEHKHEIFANINSGKIKLTCSELIKAILLADDNDIENKELVAAQFAHIEDTLNNDNRLWYMLQNNKSSYTNSRIDLIFNLVAKISKDDYEKDHNSAFYVAYKHYKNKELNQFWQKCRQCFTRIIDLYNNIESYHYIGYLTYSNKSSLPKIIERYEKKGLKACIINLKTEVIKKYLNLESDLSDISYDYGNTYLCKLFVLYNIETILQANKDKNLKFAYQYFPFELLYSNKWTIEHIYPQTDYEFKTFKEYQNWCETITKVLNIKTNLDEINASNFEPRQHSVGKILKKLGLNNVVLNNIHSLGNLTLLDDSTNKSYKNLPFGIKRNIIIDKLKENEQFIPPCTLNVFLKVYNNTSNANLLCWTEDDAKSYLDDIKAKLKDYIPKSKGEIENENK